MMSFCCGRIHWHLHGSTLFGCFRDGDLFKEDILSLLLEGRLDNHFPEDCCLFWRQRAWFGSCQHTIYIWCTTYGGEREWIVGRLSAFWVWICQSVLCAQLSSEIKILWSQLCLLLLTTSSLQHQLYLTICQLSAFWLATSLSQMLDNGFVSDVLFGWYLSSFEGAYSGLKEG